MNERFLSVGFACVVVGLFGLALQALCCLSPARSRHPGSPAVLEGRLALPLDREGIRGDRQLVLPPKAFGAGRPPR